MKKASSGRNLNANLAFLSLDLSVQALHMPRSKNSSGAYRLKIKNIALSACLVQRLYAFTTRCRTDKAGQGGLEPSPEGGARTKRFDQEIPVPRIPR